MKNTKNLFTLRTITYSAVITAIMAILIPIKVQIVGPVPITLTVFLLSLFSMLFDPKKALIAVFLYWILIVANLPIAVGYQGGIARFFSPWGGYLWLYPAFALCQMLFAKHIQKSIVWTIIAQGFALVCLYAGGVIGLMLFGKFEFIYAVEIGVMPFIAIDIIKIIIAIIITKILSKTSAIFKK